ncbi:hypothetical protein D9615_009225 [Tricholomella constricta]|uniref:Uncharacterized protein n=1 Tax=Tricholomella constricta TaxID=117010 RepID=A0A8H5GWN5_9AGAR|nr:hypothetical protein D9615_009225 [Tricholomella constricta]
MQEMKMVWFRHRNTRIYRSSRPDPLPPLSPSPFPFPSVPRPAHPPNRQGQPSFHPPPPPPACALLVHVLRYKHTTSPSKHDATTQDATSPSALRRRRDPLPPLSLSHLFLDLHIRIGSTEPTSPTKPEAKLTLPIAKKQGDPLVSLLTHAMCPRVTGRAKRISVNTSAGPVQKGLIQQGGGHT